MILTDKLKLKKPEKTEACNIEDINHNMDKIDGDIVALKEHSELSVCDEYGVHGMRYIEDDLQVYGEYGWYSLITETEYQAPGNLKKFEVIAGDEKAEIKFLEPEDIVQKGIAVCKVVGVMIRYSTETYPSTIEEGVLVLDNKEFGRYENEPYVLEGLTNKTKYYFSAFAYSDRDLYNLSAGQSICTPSGKGRLEIRSSQTCKVKLIVNEEQSDITITANQPYIAKYIGGTKVVIEPSRVEGRFMLEGGGTYTIEGDETTTVTLSLTAVPNTLNECSWYLIKKISDARQMKKFFKLGDTKTTGSGYGTRKYKLARADNEKTRFICVVGGEYYTHIYYHEPYGYTPKENEIIRVRRILLDYINNVFKEPNNNSDPSKFISYQLGYELDDSPGLRTRAYGFDLGDCLEDFLGELPNIPENRDISTKNNYFNIYFLTSAGIKNTNGKIQIFAEAHNRTSRYYKEGALGSFYEWEGMPNCFTYVLDM